jgi:hypothetical protein
METLGAKFGRWMIRSGERLVVRARSTQVTTRVENLRKFWFLADAPLFIDGSQVDRLFDAIFRPEWEATTRTRSSTNTRSRELQLQISASGEATVPTIFKLGATGTAAGKGSSSTAIGEAINEIAVRSPDRRLESLVVLYAHAYPDRLFWMNADLKAGVNAVGDAVSWEAIDKTLEESGLRPLIVLNLDAGSKVAPMRAELVTGKNVDLLKAMLGGTKLPEYPEHGMATHADRAAYWGAVLAAFSTRRAMQAVEEASGEVGAGGRIDWIDYRALAAGGAPTVHLHVSSHAQYPTGTFAYQLIRRADKYGIRVVGTLKRGQDLNVLAVYER